MKTIADHLRKRRLELGLLQREVARKIGVSTATVTHWELGERQSAVRHLPAIIRFLGYSPLAEGTTLPERLLVWRQVQGVSRKRAARVLQVDESTLARWERGKGMPGPQSSRKVGEILWAKRP